MKSGALVSPPNLYPPWFEDGLSVPDLLVYGRPLPSEKIGEEVSVGKRATVYRLVSDG